MLRPLRVLMDLVLSYQEEEEQEEEDDDEDDDDTDELDELDTDQLLEAELEEDDNNENAGDDGDNDFSPSDEELANLLEEGEDGEDEDSDADEEVELILGDSKSRAPRAKPWRPRGPVPVTGEAPLWPLEEKQFPSLVFCSPIRVRNQMAFLSHVENGLDHFFCKGQAVTTLRFVGSSVVVGT